MENSLQLKVFWPSAVQSAYLEKKKSFGSPTSQAFVKSILGKDMVLLFLYGHNLSM